MENYRKLKGMKVTLLPALWDNYNFVLELDGLVGTVDPSKDLAVPDYLRKNQLHLDFILNTHHHGDHTGGNLQLQKEYECPIYGPASEQIPGRTHSLKPGQRLSLGGQNIRVLDVKAHTLGHIAYYFEEAGVLFCGDSLFSMGCGRLFEGTAKNLKESLECIRSLPEETLIYCAHEYTKDNGRFALSLEPQNEALQSYMEEVLQRRAQNEATVPFTLKQELEINPFLRPHSLEIRAHLGLDEKCSSQEVLKSMRLAKDRFKVS